MANEPTKQGIGRAKAQQQKPVQVNKDQKFSPIEPKNEKGAYKCSCCGKVYERITNFPISNSPLFAANDGHIMVCRNCVEKYYNQLVEFYSGNEAHAMDRLCGLFDWYFSEDVFAMTRSSKAGASRANLYPSRMNLVKKKGITYIDTVKERFGEKILDEGDVKLVNPVDGEGLPSETEEKVPEVSKEVINRFGYGYTPEEYAYLEAQYNDWLNNYEHNTKSQKEIFVSLCVAQLMKQRAAAGGNVKEITDTTKMFQDLLATANIKPNQATSTTDLETYSQKLARYEKTKPLPETVGKMRDYDKIKECTDVWMLGHLRKLVHIDDEYSQKYDEELGKYTVTQPQYDINDSVTGTSVLDKFSKKRSTIDDE